MNWRDFLGDLSGYRPRYRRLKAEHDALLAQSGPLPQSDGVEVSQQEVIDLLLAQGFSGVQIRLEDNRYRLYPEEAIWAVIRWWKPPWPPTPEHWDCGDNERSLRDTLRRKLWGCAVVMVEGWITETTTHRGLAVITDERQVQPYDPSKLLMGLVPITWRPYWVWD